MLQNSVTTIALGFIPQSHCHRVNLQFCELDSRSFDTFVMIVNPNPNHSFIWDKRNKL